MIRVWTQFLGAILITVLTGTGLYTSAYFFDQEGSGSNELSATKLDGSLSGDPFDERVCIADIDVETELLFTNVGSLPFGYEVHADNVSGGGCADMELTVSISGSEVYTGPVNGLALSGYELALAENDAWQIQVNIPSNAAGGTCTFDTRFSAHQETFATGEAFYDSEVLSHTILATNDTGTSTGCVSPGDTVDLQMDKHISGVSNGFEESDFSYRIVGDGVDAIVPHGGSIALPKGTYTIEELVPEGFVKEDWRIGWYGECRRGSEFTTTIKIDDGNIDHGWLDCQADNQYRPELNTQEDVTDDDTESVEHADEGSDDQRSSGRSPRNTRNSGGNTVDQTTEGGTSTVLGATTEKEEEEGEGPATLSEESDTETEGVEEGDDGENEETVSENDGEEEKDSEPEQQQVNEEGGDEGSIPEVESSDIE